MTQPDTPAPCPADLIPVTGPEHALKLLDDVDSLVRFCSCHMLDVDRYSRGSWAFWSVAHWIAGLNRRPTPPAADAVETVAELVTLNACPPGLFLFGDTLGFKSEYTTTLENPRRYQCDAYCVESGEYFWGGAKNTEDRGKLMVQPLARAAIAAMQGQGWQDISTAPYETAVEIKAGHMTFEAMLVPDASEDENGSCDQWQAVHEGEHPPCWSGGACWDSNEDEVTSLQPEAWRPLPPAPKGE